jgi:hypothetical protein
MDYLKALEERRDALTTIIKGGIPIEGEDERAEIEARTVFDWLVRKREEVIHLIAETGVYENV